MVETARPTSGEAMPTGERDAILHAMALAAQGLLAADDVQDLAGNVLASLGAATGTSRVYVIKNRAGADGALRRTLAFEWCAGGVAPQVGTAGVDVPWDGPWDAWAHLLRAGTPVLGPVSGLAPDLRAALAARDVLSVAELPLRVAGAWWGCVGLEDAGRERVWNAAEIDSVRAIGGIVAAAEQRRRSDLRRRDAEDRYRELVEHIPGVTYTDVPGDDGIEMGFVSPQIEGILGYPVDRFRDEPELWGNLIDPEDRARLDALGAFDAGNLEPFDHEYRMRAADGRTVWVRDTSSVVLREDGTVDHFLGFMTDVTARRSAEDERGLAEERFRAIVEHNPAITYQAPHAAPPYDASSPYSYVSPQIATVLGFTPEEWTAAGFWLQQTHPEDREAVLRESERTAATEEPYRQDYRVRARDGRMVWFHDEAVLIRDEEGNPCFWQGVMVDITEQKEVEQRLRAAEERYRALVEHIPAVVYAEGVAASPELIYVSPQVERAFGYSPEEWRRSADFWEAHLHPDDHDRVMAANREANERGDSFHVEYRLLTADGSYRWVHDEAVEVLDEDGSPLFWQGVLVDITQQKAAEQGLRDADARFRAVVEHIPAVVYTESPDADPAKFYISPQVQTLFGFTPQEWTWTAGFWADHLHPDDRESALRRDAEADRTHEPYAGEFRFLTADGRWLWVHDEASFVVEPDGEGFWQGFMLDITARKEAEDQLREAELKFRTIVEQNQAIFYTQEIDETNPAVSLTTYIAPGNTEMLGYDLEDVRADPALWRRIVHPDDRERVFSADADSNQGGNDRFSMEYRMIAKDGRIVWVQDEATLVQLVNKPPYWQGFLLDVTERKEAEAQLERALTVEREATQRLRALDEMKNTFLQAVSHDLRTPLAAILGLAITLERGDMHLTEEDSRDLAHRIAGNARRLDRLVMNLLDLDRLARGIVEPKRRLTDVGELVDGILSESELVPVERLHTDIASVVVSVDAAKVERIVENLLANTVRHTPAGADVWVSVRPSQDPAGVEIAVEDNGAGVPEPLREAIFEPFRQGPEAPRHSPGVGVGLTLVRRFAELHGGRAWVQEREGGGASFRVVLPASDDFPRGDHGVVDGGGADLRRTAG
jgi:PAS domain S-box-containing protein